MAKAKQQQYGNESISMLKDEERVRKRPAARIKRPNAKFVPVRRSAKGKERQINTCP